MDEHNLWQGNKVRLRSVEPDDWQVFYRWNADSESARSSYYIPFPSSAERAKKWTAELAVAEPQADAFRWVIENEHGQAVGTLNTHDCNPRAGTFSYGVAVQREHWRKGYAAEAICLVLRYFFRELRYQKATVHVYDFNTASIRLHEKLGFRHEGRLRRMIYTGGAHHDEIVLGMTAEEFDTREIEEKQRRAGSAAGETGDTP